MMSVPRFVAVRRALSGMSYPATRDELVEHARGNQAAGDIVNVLSALPDRTYDGPDAVSGTVREVTGDQPHDH